MYHTMTIAGVQAGLPICKVSDDLEYRWIRRFPATSS